MKAAETSIEQCLQKCIELLEKNNILPSSLRLVATKSYVNGRTVKPYINECSKDIYVHVNGEAKQLHVEGRSELKYNITNELNVNGNETSVS